MPEVQDRPPAGAGGGREPVRPAVAALGPSVARCPPTAWTVEPNTATLHLNESPWPPSPRVIDAIQRRAAEVFHYPDPRPTALLAALSSRTGVPPRRIVLGAGTDELIQTIASTFLETSRSAVMPEPAFPKYRQACLVSGADTVAVPLAPDGHVDVDRLLAACNARTRVLFVPTPNNPTGGFIPAPDLARLVDRAPHGALLVFDEAYHEFARAAGAPDLVAMLERSSARWIVLRSFSKAYGLAGLRIGYALTGDDDLAEWMARVHPVFNVSHLSAVAALAALDDEVYRDALVAFTAGERARLAGALVRCGLGVLPSATNFLAVDLGRDARPVVAALRACGILVAGIPGADYQRFVRITIGTAEQNDAVVAALEGLDEETAGR